MNLYEIFDDVRQSDGGAWEIAIEGGQVGGAVLDYGQHRGASGDLEFAIFGVDAHHTLAVHPGNPTISLAWGLQDHTRGEPWGEGETWSHGFPNPSVTSYNADLRLNGAVIHRAMVCIVDGGRATLPVPMRDGDSGFYVEGHTIGYAIARVIHEIHGPSTSMESYLERAGITIR